MTVRLEGMEEKNMSADRLLTETEINRAAYKRNEIFKGSSLEYTRKADADKCIVEAQDAKTALNVGGGSKMATEGNLVTDPHLLRMMVPSPPPFYCPVHGAREQDLMVEGVVFCTLCLLEKMFELGMKPMKRNLPEG